jgi:hypothetical protein
MDNQLVQCFASWLSRCRVYVYCTLHNRNNIMCSTLCSVHSDNQSADSNTEVCRLVEGAKAEVYSVVTIILPLFQIAIIYLLLCKLSFIQPANLCNPVSCKETSTDKCFDRNSLCSLPPDNFSSLGKLRTANPTTVMTTTIVHTHNVVIALHCGHCCLHSKMCCLCCGLFQIADICYGCIVVGI